MDQVYRCDNAKSMVKNQGAASDYRCPLGEKKSYPIFPHVTRTICHECKKKAAEKAGGPFDIKDSTGKYKPVKIFYWW